MIDFSKIGIDLDKIKEIEKIPNSCGVVVCYILSLIYKFDFEISEFYGIGEGMTSDDIRRYAERNGVNVACVDGVGVVSYADYNVLLKNDIIGCVFGDNTGYNGNPHASIARYMSSNVINQLYSHEVETLVKNIKDMNTYFFYKDANISDFVTFTKAT